MASRLRAVVHPPDLQHVWSKLLCAKDREDILIDVIRLSDNRNRSKDPTFFEDGI